MSSAVPGCEHRGSKHQRVFADVLEHSIDRLAGSFVAAAAPSIGLAS